MRLLVAQHACPVDCLSAVLYSAILSNIRLFSLVSLFAMVEFRRWCIINAGREDEAETGVWGRCAGGLVACRVSSLMSSLLGQRDYDYTGGMATGTRRLVVVVNAWPWHFSSPPGPLSAGGPMLAEASFTVISPPHDIPISVDTLNSPMSLVKSQTHWNNPLSYKGKVSMISMSHPLAPPAFA
jgi:hypothetical protein